MSSIKWLKDAIQTPIVKTCNSVKDAHSFMVTGEDLTDSVEWIVLFLPWEITSDFMREERIKIAKMNNGNGNLKFILIGIVIGIVIGMIIFFLLVNFGVIKPFNLFRDSMNRDFAGFPEGGNFPRNGTMPGMPQ